MSLRTLPDRSTRLFAAVLAVLMLAGCAAAEEQPSPTAATTRAVVDVDGNDVVVPEHPQRVVTLSEPTLDAALALGVDPVGTVTGRGQSTVPNYLLGQAADIPILGGVAQPNYEAIGAAKPDLILVDGTSINNNQPALDALAQIAPVVYTGYAGGDWRDNLALVADALNLADAGDELIAAYDDRAAALKPRLADYAGATFSVVRWQGGSASLILKELLPGRALTDLGLQRPANQDRNGRGHSDPVSLENLQDIDADYLFFSTLGGSSVDNPSAGGAADVSGAEQALADAEAVPGFTQLNAYRQGHIIPVDGSVWSSTGGPLLMNRLLDDIEQALL